MRNIPYNEIKKRLKVVGFEDGKHKWLFEPGSLNDGLKPWDYEYLDPMFVYTQQKNYFTAARLVGCNEGIYIVYPWRKH